jgi:formylglycine-generating enzyme required for sulfatase activity
MHSSKWTFVGLLIAVAGCGVSVVPDSAVEDRAEPRDAADVRELDGGVGDVADADASDGDSASPVDVSDADAGDAMTFEDVVVPCLPARPAPAGVGRSCTAENIDQCREVHYCGGQFTAGHPSALVPYGARLQTGISPFRPCDFYRAVVRSGYVDAYEVTVARFRRWVEAGRPTPPVGTRIMPGVEWTESLNEAVNALPFPSYAMDGTWPASAGVRREACTWTASAGANENLPLNCVEPIHAQAFCWWDGKGLINEAAWEYLATNRGVSGTSFGTAVIDGTLCDMADVGALAEGASAGTTLCPRRALPLPFDARPRDVTADPAGVFAMFGGLRELLVPVVDVPAGLYARQGWDPTCASAYPKVVVEGAGRWTLGPPSGQMLIPYRQTEFVTRGVAWSDNRTMLDQWKYAASRPSQLPPTTTMVDVGFRCHRWESP